MPTKEEAAQKLAAAHYEVEPGISQIFRLNRSADLESRREEPIKLLEVNEETIPSGIMPLSFGAAPQYGIDFPSIVVEVTPEEFLQIQRQDLILPLGWAIGELLPRAPQNGGS